MNTVTTDTTTTEIQEAFSRLGRELPYHQRTAHCSADDFMLMQIEHKSAGVNLQVTVYGFKHRDTRNYVFLYPDRLEIPANDLPFLRGEFNAPDAQTANR